VRKVILPIFRGFRDGAFGGGAVGARTHTKFHEFNRLRDRMMPMPDILTVLSEISSIAVIAGVVLIIFQLKQNAKETRATAAFALLEKLTDESYVRRRKRML